MSVGDKTEVAMQRASIQYFQWWDHPTVGLCINATIPVYLLQLFAKQVIHFTFMLDYFTFLVTLVKVLHMGNQTVVYVLYLQETGKKKCTH